MRATLGVRAMGPVHHADESASNAQRDLAARLEPRTLRTYTPSQAVLARSEGVFHWTPEGRRLYDFTSGVLVSNLGHYPPQWLERFFRHMGWRTDGQKLDLKHALTFTAYNAVTPVEAEASLRLLNF